MQKSVLAVMAVLILGLSASALANESRLFRDKDAVTRAPGVIEPSIVGLGGNHYRIDASAVLSSVDPAVLYRKATDYDHYTEMKMPNLDASEVVERDEPANVLWTWANMSIYMLRSKHYLEVQLHPDDLAGGATGMEWFQVRKQPEWAHEEASQFNQLDGSFYIEPQADGTVYVRYFLEVDINNGLASLVPGIVKNNLRDGVRQVIQVLAHQAAIKQ